MRDSHKMKENKVCSLFSLYICLEIRSIEVEFW